jgi:hypothetical protein
MSDPAKVWSISLPTTFFLSTPWRINEASILERLSGEYLKRKSMSSRAMAIVLSKLLVSVSEAGLYV